jgi:hypothetical protein
VVFKFIIFAPFLKCNISIMCHYKIMEKKPLKDQLSDFIYLYFHFYNHYINVYIHFFSKVPSFWLYSEKICHCCHWHAFQFPIRDHKGMSDSCTLSICSSLTSVWCLGMKRDHSSSLTELSSENTHSQLGLLRHWMPHW